MKEKMTEEELQERYEKKQAENIDSEEISTKSGNSEALKKHKKIDLATKFISGVLVGVMTVSGFCMAKSAKTIKIPEEPTTSQGGPETTDPQEDFKYVLVKPFDINDEKSVNATIDAVNENNAKDDSVDAGLTVKTLKYYNGDLSKDDFKDMNDDEIANSVKNITIETYEVAGASVTDFTNLKKGEKLTDGEKSVKAIGLSDTLSENGYAYKTYATKYDEIIEEQKSDIDDGNKEDYSENTENFVYTVKTALDDDKLTNAEKSDIATTSKSHLTLFYDTMTKDDQAYFRTEYESPYNTSALDEWLVKNDITTDIDFGKTNSGDKSKNEYVDSDKKDAEKHAGPTGEDKTKLVDKGNKKIGGGKGQQEIIDNPTTKITSETKIADVPDKELNKPTKTYEGGEVVSTKKEVETTKKIQEENVEPETETTTNNMNSLKDNKETTTEETVDVKDENGNAVLTEEQFNKLKEEQKKREQLLIGIAVLAGLFGIVIVTKKIKYNDGDSIEKGSPKVKK